MDTAKPNQKDLILSVSPQNVCRFQGIYQCSLEGVSDDLLMHENGIFTFTSMSILLVGLQNTIHGTLKGLDSLLEGPIRVEVYRRGGKLLGVQSMIPFLSNFTPFFVVADLALFEGHFHHQKWARSNFGGVAWSPDGTLLASTFTSAMADGLVQVWNPQTGAIAFTLAKQTGYGYGNIAWSGDGHYIAAMAWSWTGGAEQITVWSVQTHQVVFQVVNGQGLSGVTWQPGTDNLASALLIPGSDSNLPGPPVYNTAILKVWNVMTKQVLTTFQGVNGSSLTWSPDGKQLAYASIVNPNTRSTVTILDVQSGQKLYTYTGSVPSDVSFDTPAWSPDGTYIATIASKQDISGAPTSPPWPQSGVVQVWVA